MNRREWVPHWMRQFYAFNHVSRTIWIAEQAKKIPAGSKLLDMGAGASPYRLFFPHCDYQAHDFAKLNPEQLWEGVGYAPLNYISDINSIPVRSESYDVVLCTEVIEHVPEPIKAVKEMGRILKPHGRLLLTAPLGSGLHQEPYHFYGGYTPYWYQKILKEAGFEQISIEPNGGFFQHFAQESIRFSMLTAPWRDRSRLLWLPLWIPFSIWGLFLAPLVGPILDKQFDEGLGFTIGYHVTAIRAACV